MCDIFLVLTLPCLEDRMISTTNDFDALGYLLPRYLRVDNILDATTTENIEGKCMEPIANILELPWIERF